MDESSEEYRGVLFIISYLLLLQSRVRECLVNLLNTTGQKVGLPKSPSVSKIECFLIFAPNLVTLYKMYSRTFFVNLKICF